MRYIFTFLSGLLILTSCGRHFITDESYRQTVLEDLQAKDDVMNAAGIDLESMGLATDELEAMQFMYAYMPLGDMLNHEPGFFLDHYHMTRRALSEMPWGKRVPERELRHFVLPARTNNENIDSARYFFYEELAPRVRNMSMRDAVLEVNHWCHEKAIYMPSDRRTSSPLATVKTAYGRCGEESTLLVAALRAVGIPARQVYTPRWAQTDSNHAWVEAWVDGEWCFLGACEPEPVLNLAWFNAPASRGMLMHTNVMGKYDGPEEVVRQDRLFTEINVIENYAPESAKVMVRVVDREGNPAEGARVAFQIYNYSEFTDVARKMSDAEGRASLTAGLGDVMAYASKGGFFGFAKVSCGKDGETVIRLEHEEGSVVPHLEMEVVPPVENARIPDVTDSQRAENTLRMEYEDSLRNAYVASFFNKTRAEALAAELGLDPDRTARVMVASRGNHPEIETLLRKAAAKDLGKTALDLLLAVSEKDLRDTPAAVLADHLFNTPASADPDKVLCPRMTHELLTPYRAYLQTAVPSSLSDSVRRDPALLVNWCKDNLSLRDDISLRYVYVKPQRVWETRIADIYSRDLFFVAMCRSFGVPAWSDPVTGILKYEKDGLVYDVDFDAEEQSVAPKGRLRLVYDEIPLLDDPKYKTHFTISRYEDGRFKALNYGSAVWSDLFRKPAEMDCGYYMLVSGSRMSGGNVFADVEFFTVEEGKTTVKNLVMRDIKDQIRVIGSFDSEAKYLALDFKAASDGSPDETQDCRFELAERVEKSILETTGRGYFAVALVDYGTEPTNHAFMDISAAAAELEAWGRPLVVIFATEDDCRKFRSEHFDLPSTVKFGIDKDGSIRRMIATEMKLEKNGRLPLIVLADTFNRVVFFSQGYTIGLGDSLAKTSKAL